MHHYARATSLGLTLLLSVASLTGCGDDSATATCEAGRQIPCACGGGEEGFQRCRDDGSGYEACQCDGVDAGGDTGTGDAAADSGMTDSGSDSGADGDSSVDSGADGGASSCDDGLVHVVGSAECASCSECAGMAGGPCHDAFTACDTEPDCEAFATCFAACETDMCADQCIVDHPTGLEAYGNWLSCVDCTACPNNCSGSDTECTP